MPRRTLALPDRAGGGDLPVRRSDGGGGGQGAGPAGSGANRLRLSLCRVALAVYTPLLAVYVLPTQGYTLLFQSDCLSSRRDLPYFSKCFRSFSKSSLLIRPCCQRPVR